MLLLQGNNQPTNQPALNSAAERMTMPVALMKSLQLQLLFTGGSGELMSSTLSEAGRATPWTAYSLQGGAQR